MSEELYNSNDYCKLAEEFEELKKENAELARDKDHLMNLFMERSEYVFSVVSNMKINDLGQKCKRLEADYEISNRELLVKQVEITALRAEIERLQAAQRWIPVSERLPEANEMSVSEHANYLLNEYGRLQFDYVAYCKPYGESLRNEARNNLEEYIAKLEAENAMLKQLPQPIKFWSDEKKQIYKINERRSVKSGSEECGE